MTDKHSKAPSQGGMECRKEGLGAGEKKIPVFFVRGKQQSPTNLRDILFRPARRKRGKREKKDQKQGRTPGKSRTSSVDQRKGKTRKKQGRKNDRAAHQKPKKKRDELKTGKELFPPGETRGEEGEGGKISQHGQALQQKKQSEYPLFCTEPAGSEERRRKRGHLRVRITSFSGACRKN